MKYYFLLCLLLFGGGRLIAQGSIVDALTRNVPGQGKVVIHQSSAIHKLIGVPSASDKMEEVNGTKYFILTGYRIQVFSGNDQRNAKDEAFGKQQQILKSYPDVPTYVSYTAPFWRLRVGDFLSYEEAYDTIHKFDSRLRHVPGGIDEYLRLHADQRESSITENKPAARTPSHAEGLSGANLRAARKEISAIERKLGKLSNQIESIHTQMASHDQSDYEGLDRLSREIKSLQDESAELENRWLEISEQVEQ